MPDRRANAHGNKSKEQQVARFAVVIDYSDPEGVSKVRPVHREYLTKLVEQGKIYATGPFVDNKGALLVYDAADEDEVRELLANDPYGKAGVVTVVSIREWNIVMEGTAGSGKS